jgi:hypothetical protein
MKDRLKWSCDCPSSRTVRGGGVNSTTMIELNAETHKSTRRRDGYPPTWVLTMYDQSPPDLLCGGDVERTSLFLVPFSASRHTSPSHTSIKEGRAVIIAIVNEYNIRGEKCARN